MNILHHRLVRIDKRSQMEHRGAKRSVVEPNGTKWSLVEVSGTKYLFLLCGLWVLCLLCGSSKATSRCYSFIFDGIISYNVIFIQQKVLSNCRQDIGSKICLAWCTTHRWERHLQLVVEHELSEMEKSQNSQYSWCEQG